jgi:glycosyltransferase involved in cell wall biosynthesis
MPKLSIITVNLNNTKGLERTMNSVFHQTFKDFEYIIIDGGSTDGSKELIENGSNNFVYWVSERDNGIYHAMNKGIKKAKGDYLLFLNSGDYLINDGILENIISELDGTGIIYGNIFLVINREKSWTGHYPAKLSFQYFVDSSLPHPATFIKRTLFDKVGFYNESMKIIADWKFFLDAICRYNASYKHIDKTISVYDHNGLSSKAENLEGMQKEKRTVLEEEYAVFLNDINELKQLRAFRNSPLISKYASVMKAIGLIKDVSYHG